ncbi:glutathione S-transferase P-like isoform X1 [Pleurodeles waltl]|uniref:glutathione S-transferase P-like isoform X1 n=1 Tax=Pleurodeles waltl TaxID=8319 RepID=UPI00370960C4
MGHGAASKCTVSQYTITYFPFRGRTETLRFLLADQGCEWKEDVVSFQDWHAGKVELKQKAIFGQIPMFADGDFILFQSKAIFRYLGRKYDLYGKNNKEAALIDMACDGVEDLREKLFRLFVYEGETGRAKYIEQLPSKLRPFEQLLSQNSSGFIIGSKVSFADYNLLEILHHHLYIARDCLNNFPHLKAFKEKMESRPKLKAYLQSKDYKNRPFLLT